MDALASVHGASATLRSARATMRRIHVIFPPSCCGRFASKRRSKQYSPAGNLILPSRGGIYRRLAAVGAFSNSVNLYQGDYPA